MYQVLLLASIATASAAQFPNPYGKSLRRQFYDQIFGYNATSPKRDNTTTVKPIFCPGKLFNDVYYDVEVIAEPLGRPYNLVLHKLSGTLFFSHTIESGGVVDFSIMACNIRNKSCEDVKGIPGGFAVAYDSGNDDIYLGGHDGIYKYNFLTRQPEFFAEDGKSIWGLFVRRNFYYILYPIQRLYVYQDKKFVAVAESKDYEVDQFLVTKQQHVYFSNTTAFFKVDKTTKEYIAFDYNIMVRQLQEDLFGDVYVCANNGIYVVEHRRLKKVLDVDQAFGMAFDENENVIYSDENKIYRLLPSPQARVCYNFMYGLKIKKVDKLRVNWLNTYVKPTYENFGSTESVLQKLKSVFI